MNALTQYITRYFQSMHYVAIAVLTVVAIVAVLLGNLMYATYRMATRS